MPPGPKPPSYSPMWNPTENLYEALADLPARLKIAWLEAQAHPEMADQIMQAAISNATYVSRVTTLHLRGSVERAKRREDASYRATVAAEKRVKTALANVQAESLADGGFDPHGYFIYCLWGDDASIPLYVGKSTNILARLGAHLGDRRKRYSVERVTVTRCQTYKQMSDNEERLIQHYQPPLNTVGIRRVV